MNFDEMIENSIHQVKLVNQPNTGRSSVELPQKISYTVLYTIIQLEWIKLHHQRQMESMEYMKIDETQVQEIKYM